MKANFDAALFKRSMWSLAAALLLSFTGTMTSGCFTSDKKDKGDEMSADDDADKPKKKKKKKPAKKKKSDDGSGGGSGSGSGSGGSDGM